VSFDHVLFAALVRAADCEAVHEGVLQQPVNAVSSLALLAAGLWIVLRARRGEPEERGARSAFGVGMAVVGLGSVLLHGPDPGWALWFHDLSGLAVLLLVAALDLGMVIGWSLRSRLLAVVAGLVVLAVTLAIIPTSTVPIAFLLAPVAVLSELALLRSADRSSPRAGSSDATTGAVAVAAIALGGGAYLLGRTGSTLCNPESVVQWHAVWHVMVAISAAAFAAIALGHRSRTIASDRRLRSGD
jgi:hypothetical protein